MHLISTRIKVFSFESQCHIHQNNQCRDFDQRADDSGKGLSAIDTKYTDSHGNSQLKVIACGRKRNGGILTIIGSHDFLNHLILIGLIDQPMGLEKRGILLYEFCKTYYPEYRDAVTIA